MKKYIIINKDFSFNIDYEEFNNTSFLISDITTFFFILGKYKNNFFNKNNKFYYSFDLNINVEKIVNFHKKWKLLLSNFFKTEYKGLTLPEYQRLDKREKLTVSRNSKLNNKLNLLFKEMKLTNEEIKIVKIGYNYKKTLNYNFLYHNSLYFITSLISQNFFYYNQNLKKEIDYKILNDTNKINKITVEDKNINKGIIILSSSDNYDNINKILKNIIEN